MNNKNQKVHFSCHRQSHFCWVFTPHHKYERKPSNVIGILGNMSILNYNKQEILSTFKIQLLLTEISETGPK